MRIKGELRKGYNVARYTLRRQMPFLTEYLPELESCHPGTLNIQLATPLLILAPDIRTPRIKWAPDFPRESFQFTKIGLEVLSSGQTRVIPAWIYASSLSPHRGDPFSIEVVAPYLALDGSETFVIDIDREVRTATIVIVE